MSATVSPHDATKSEDGILRSVSRFFWNVLAYPFATHGELKWATGILSVDDDFETCAKKSTVINIAAVNFLPNAFHTLLVHNANACLVCTLPYVAAKMVTDINDGFNVCSIPQEQISRVPNPRLSFHPPPSSPPHHHHRLVLMSLQFTESQCGCTFKEVAVCFNLIYVCLCPCTLCFWRSKLRNARRLEVQ